MGCQRCLHFGAPKRLDHSLIWTRGVSRRLVIGVRQSYTCLADAELALGISRTHCKPTWAGIRLCGKFFSQAWPSAYVTGHVAAAACDGGCLQGPEGAPRHTAESLGEACPCTHQRLGHVDRIHRPRRWCGTMSSKSFRVVVLKTSSDWRSPTRN